jgi:tripartite-type tricarboxylate transporter receptor subunit TctC
MKIIHLFISLFLGCILLIGITGEVKGEEFPKKPIEIYVGWGGGGSTCMQTRVLAHKLSEILLVPVLVIPKPGAGGTLANDYVRRAKPDGYSLCVATTSNTIANLLLQKVPYKTEDFQYLCQFSNQATILCVNNNAPWKTLSDLIAYAQKHPEELKYPTPGIGTGAHIIMEQFNRAANIKTIHVPMKSGSEQVAAILGNHCQIASIYPLDVGAALEAGRIRGLAVNNPRRLAKFPDIPTFAELGFPSVVYNTYYGIAAPKGIPQSISKILIDSLGKAAQDKDVQKTLEQFGLLPEYKTAEEFEKMIFSEYKRIHKLFKDIGIPIVQ